jgi:hypothetical protein
VPVTIEKRSGLMNVKRAVIIDNRRMDKGNHTNHKGKHQNGKGKMMAFQAG